MPGSRGKKRIWILSNARETWINQCVIAHSLTLEEHFSYFLLKRLILMEKSYNFKTLDGLDNILLFERVSREITVCCLSF